MSFQIGGGSTLTNNTAVGSQNGFNLFQASGTSLDSNSARGNGRNFNIQLFSGNTLSNNIARGPGEGFVLFENFDNNTFVRNMAIGGSFSLNGSSGNTFTRNTVREPRSREAPRRRPLTNSGDSAQIYAAPICFSRASMSK